MRAAQLVAVAFVAALIGAGVDRLLPKRSPAGGFEVRDVRWFRHEEPGFASDSGQAKVVGTGAAATGRYIVLYEFIRSQRINPADLPDTLFGTVITSGGVATISGEDDGWGCSKYPQAARCAKELRPLTATFRIAGWTRLEEPPDSR